jgi:hypothetical protein
MIGLNNHCRIRIIFLIHLNAVFFDPRSGRALIALVSRRSKRENLV